jgi:hypothetical protein
MFQGSGEGISNISALESPMFASILLVIDTGASLRVKCKREYASTFFS